MAVAFSKFLKPVLKSSVACVPPLGSKMPLEDLTQHIREELQAAASPLDQLNGVEYGSSDIPAEANLEQEPDSQALVNEAASS